MVAGDADEGRGDLAVGHQLGLFQRALHRGHRGLDVHYHAFLQALRLVAAHAEHGERAVGAELGDQASHLRGSDIQRHDQVLVFLGHQLSSSGRRTAKPFG
jgi:hypothetical protein